MINRCGVMALVAAYLNFLSQMIANPPFCQHISKVSEVPQFLLFLVPASDGSLFSGDRAEEPDGAVSAPRTRVQRQVSVSLRLVDLKPPDASWRTFSCPKTSDSIHQPEDLTSTSRSHLSPSVFRLPEALEKVDQPLFFQSADMAECLSGPGYNVEKLSLPYVPQVTGEEPQWVQLGDRRRSRFNVCRLFLSPPSVLYTVGKILHRCKQTSRGTCC